MKKQTLLTSFIILLFTNFLLAQSKHITGKVSSSLDGTALTGVSVKVNSGNIGTVTDFDGKYSIDVPKGTILIFSSIGYNDGTIKVGDDNVIDMVMIQITATLNQVVVVGTRSPGRALLDTPVPVDVVNINQVTLPTARMDLTSILNYSAPSFNYNKQSGSDGADHIDLATLRGLGPDQVLVLINGKRRHQTAFVSVFGTRGRGNSGTDLNALPAAAIDRVEILRDGASAQYGSDAIAGVINLVLKKSTNELNVNAGYSGYYDKSFNPYFKKDLNQYVYEGALDGKTFSMDANYGIPLKRDGFINFTLNYVNAGKTFRQVLDTANLFTSKTSLPINPYRRANGDGSLDMFGAFVNSEVPLNNEGTTLYFFSGYNHKNSDAYAFTRNFSARPDRFPTDANGNLIDVQGIIMHTTDDQYFNPHIQTKITDFSIAAGVKGKMANGWDWDISNTLGNNDFHFYGDKTFNASLGQADKNHFDDGGFSFLQNTANINFTKEMANVMSGLNLAIGAEYRLEEYKIFAGEEASYKNYDPTGNKATGSQGFPGYQPSDVVDANRSNVGLYVDAELDVTKRWLIGGAVRIENYSDFGVAPNFKLDTRYKLNDHINLRGSVSTGFRAPSLQQINFSSTFTTVQGGVISEVKIAPNENAITRAAGIPELKQETSLNGSLGFTAKVNTNISLSVDAYWVQVKDRVVLSGQFSSGDTTLNPELITALKDLKVGLAQFFANAVNTTNKGVDIVLEINKRFIGKQRLKILFTGNIQKMTIDKINVPDKLNTTEEHRKNFLSDREQKFILASAPPFKLGLNVEYSYSKFTIGTRLTYFGDVTLLGYGQDGLGIDPMVPTDANPNITVPDSYKYEAKLVSDLYLSFRFTKNLKLFIGTDNVFNVHPSLGAVQSAKYWAYNNETGGPWDAVQMGDNGRRFFARLAMNF